MAGRASPQEAVEAVKVASHCRVAFKLSSILVVETTVVVATVHWRCTSVRTTRAPTPKPSKVFVTTKKSGKRCCFLLR